MSEPTYRRLPDLELWDRNPNEGDVSAVASSVQTFGFNGRVAVHGDTVMAGNTSTKALIVAARGVGRGGDWVGHLAAQQQMDRCIEKLAARQAKTEA